MKKIFLLFLLLLTTVIVKPQMTTSKSWDHRYGGNAFEFPATLLKTMDGGYLMCGNSLSPASFDKSEAGRNGLDYWIIKTDNSGIKQWDKTFGGAETDNLTCAILLPDSGYLLGGYSSSGNSGDKSQDNASPLDPTDDYWIVRIDKKGNIKWDKTFGGDKKDRLNSLLQLPDGSFLLGGYSISDGTGDMSNYSYGENDFWLIKIDGFGNKIWDYNYGGLNDDRLITLSLTSDNNIIMAGYSNSPPGICKTQSPCNNSYDYWIVKINQNGTKLWDKSYGGTSKDNYSCMTFLPGDKMVLCGMSFPGSGCEKTKDNNGNLGYTDFWVVCTDSSGNKLWDHVYGGDRNEDEINNVSVTTEGILISGASYSFMTGDKSENNVLNAEQPWIFTIDTLGNKLWDKTLHNPTHTEFCYGFQEKDGCYIFLSNIITDGGYVSEQRNSADDFWLAKFCISQMKAKANYTSSSVTLCQNSCIEFTNGSQNATSFKWLFPGGNPSSDTSANPPSICYSNQGTYDVTLIAANNVDTDTFRLTNYLTVYPEIQFAPLRQNGDTIYSIPGFSNYDWYFENMLVNSGNKHYYVATASGNYSVLVTDSNGCQALASLLQVIAFADNLPKETDVLSVKYYPGFLFIDSSSQLPKSVLIKFTDVLGKIIYNKKIQLKSGLNVVPLNQDNFPAGIYFINIQNLNQTTTLKLFIN